MISLPGRIPVRIHPMFWVVAALIGWINSFSVLGTLIWIVIIFFSILVHEYGHALTSLAFGQYPRIDLIGFGGMTSRQGQQDKLWKEFLIVANGPLAGFALFLVCWQVRQFLPEESETLGVYLLDRMVVVNLIWTILNLLPVYPLDGGHLLTILLRGMFGFRGYKISLFLSFVLAGLISVFFFLVHAIIIGALFMLFAFESFRNWQQSLHMTRKDQDKSLQLMLEMAKSDLRNGFEDQAFDKLEKLKAQAGRGILATTATLLQAEILSRRHDFDRVYALLRPELDRLDAPSLKLLQEASYQTSRYKEAIQYGEKLHQMSPGYDTAFMNALCYAQEQEVRPAVGWLQRAIKEGLPNPKHAMQNNDFDPIRREPAFMEIQDQVS